MSESRGYSTVLVNLALRQDPRRPITKLAKLCFKREVSVIEVAQRLRVSRAAVYAWFKGAADPHKRHLPAIELLIAELSA